MKARKRSFMAHYIQSGRRFEAIQKRRQGEHEKTKPEGGENEDERIMRKLAKSQKLYRRERVKKQEPWVPTQKIPRYDGDHHHDNLSRFLALSLDQT